MAVYPSTLPRPSINSFSLEPKESRRKMVTDTGSIRNRRASTGQRYFGNFSFVFKSRSERDEFLNFLKNDINYTDYWFEADWLDEIGFNAGEWLFRYTSTTTVESGVGSTYKLGFMVRPVRKIDKYGNVDEYTPRTDIWPTPSTDIPSECQVPMGGAVTDDSVQVTDDAIDVTQDKVYPTVVPTVVPFDYATSVAAQLPEIVEPLTGNPKWVNLVANTFQAGDDYFLSDTYGAPPTTDVFGETESAMHGSLLNQKLAPTCTSYILWDDFSVSLRDNIDFGIMEFGFACQQVFRIDNEYPKVRVRVEFLDCINTPQFVAYSDVIRPQDESVWQEIRVEAVIPPNTRAVRVYFEQKRGDGTIDAYYSRIDNCLMAYRSCT